MTKYISLFGATTTDTQVQVVKENQVIIGIGAGASRKRYVVYKVEHTARGYVYHMVDTETKEISQTEGRERSLRQVGESQVQTQENRR